MNNITRILDELDRLIEVEKVLKKQITKGYPTGSEWIAIEKILKRTDEIGKRMDHKFDTSEYVKIPAISKDKDYDQLLADARELQKALDKVVGCEADLFGSEVAEALETFTKKYGKQ